MGLRAPRERNRVLVLTCRMKRSWLPLHAAYFFQSTPYRVHACNGFSTEAPYMCCRLHSTRWVCQAKKLRMRTFSYQRSNALLCILSPCPLPSAFNAAGMASVLQPPDTLRKRKLEPIWPRFFVPPPGLKTWDGAFNANLSQPSVLQYLSSRMQ